MYPSNSKDNFKSFATLSDDIQVLYSVNAGSLPIAYNTNNRNMIIPDSWGTNNITVNLTALHEENTLMWIRHQSGRSITGTLNFYINNVLKKTVSFTNLADYNILLACSISLKANDVVKLELSVSTSTTQIMVYSNTGVYNT